MQKNTITFDIKSFVSEDKFIKLETHVYDGRKNFYTKLINTEEKFIRNALVKLGWTPPKG